MNHPSVAPAFVLARAGYDVWLGNSRGNKYSHSASVQKSNYDFWDIGYENMGDDDITTEISYILGITKQPKLAYIGHSQGTSQMYWALSHNEDFFADKVSLFVALGPVMRLSHSKSSLINIFAQADTLIVDTCDLLGIYEFFPANWLTTGAMRLLCGTIPTLCELGIYLIADEDMSLNDDSRVQVYMGHFPSGTSLRTLDHYGQTIKGGEMRRYDFGKTKNQQIYGQAAPPIIDLTNIKKVPIAMFVGTKDELADVDDN